jgi:RNA polymerase sigma-70 factor (ECF subfamily)
MTSDTTPAGGVTFDDVVLPHLGAAHRLARWLMRNDHDAEDVVQDASLRALRYFNTFTGGNGRAWFLRIVRNSCHGRRTRESRADIDPFDEEFHSASQPEADPETLLLRADDTAQIDSAIALLPSRAREILVLRELEGLSYQELAEVLNLPAGTVMSALWRARRALRAALDAGITQAPRGFNRHKETTDASVHGYSRAHSGPDRRGRHRGPSGRPQNAGEAQRQVPHVLV